MRSTPLPLERSPSATPIGGDAGAWLSDAATWALAVPIGAVFRGLLIGIAIAAALFAARTLLGIGTPDE